jgi:hypothetical protein
MARDDGWLMGALAAQDAYRGEGEFPAPPPTGIRTGAMPRSFEEYLAAATVPRPPPPMREDTLRNQFKAGAWEGLRDWSSINRPLPGEVGIGIEPEVAEMREGMLGKRAASVPPPDDPAGYVARQVGQGVAGPTNYMAGPLSGLLWGAGGGVGAGLAGYAARGTRAEVPAQILGSILAPAAAPSVARGVSSLAGRGLDMLPPGSLGMGAGGRMIQPTIPREAPGGRMGSVAEDPLAWATGPERPQGNYMVRFDAKGNPSLGLVGGGHGFSGVKSSVPVEEARFNIRDPVSPANPRTFDIEELQRRNAALILAGHDRMMGGGELLGAGGRTFKRPVALEAGPNYPGMHEGKTLLPDDPAAAVLFANAPGPASKFVSEAQRVQKEGMEPYLAGVAMNKMGGDSSKQMARTVHEAVRVAPIDKNLAGVMNESVLTELKQVKGETLPFPGIKSRELGTWIENAGGARRAAFVKGLDRARFINEAGLDVGELRIANTNPLLLNTPTGSVGRLIGKMRPEAGTLSADLHSTYPTSFFGERGQIGGLQGSAPFHLVAPDVHRGLLRAGVPEKFANMPAYYAVQEFPAGVSRTQPVTQEVVDNLGNFFRRYPQGWAVPGAVGLGALADQGRYD